MLESIVLVIQAKGLHLFSSPPAEAWLYYLGDLSERATPVLIPNTEVKPFSADDTWAVQALGK